MLKGGTLLPDAGLDEHLIGNVLEFDYFLKNTEGNIEKPWKKH